MIAYVNHYIDDALRAGLLAEADLPAKPIALLGRTTSKRISRLVTDVILQTMKAELDQVRMSEEVLDALLALRAFLFEAVYENSDATVEFKKASGILGGLWEKVREQPGSFLDEGIVATEGIDTAARDFLAGMTDRFAVSLYERLFIPKPWVELV